MSRRQALALLMCVCAFLYACGGGDPTAEGMPEAEPDDEGGADEGIGRFRTWADYEAASANGAGPFRIVEVGTVVGP